jgi:hypothetical protein
VVERLAGVFARVDVGGPFCLPDLPPAANVRFVDDGEFDRVEAGLPRVELLPNLVTERGRRDEVGDVGELRCERSIGRLADAFWNR